MSTVLVAPSPSLWARFVRARPEVWLGLPWVIGFVALLAAQFYLGFDYKSNDTTNLYLRLARGAAWALLPLLAVMWLPVMRNLFNLLEATWIGRWLPLEGARAAHRWLGHLLAALALLHGSQYLIYNATLEIPFSDALFGREADLVRSMRTSMYDFVTEDESIDTVERWIAAGTPHDMYIKEVQPIMRLDCTKCHNTTATRTYAKNDMPLSTYTEVVSWTRDGVASRQFRINMSGLVMLVLFAAIWFTSLAVRRKKAFNGFQTVHRLGYLAALLMLLHIPTLSWVVAPVTVVLAELWLSRRRRLYRDCPAQLELVTADVLRLEITCPAGVRSAPGHYVQLRVPAFCGGRWLRDEWHAFSLSDPGADTDRLVLKVRAMGDWSRQLLAQAAAGQREMRVDVRGPFASPAAQAMVHGDWLLIAGGIGVTPFLSLLRGLLASDKSRDVHLVWVLRQPALLKWVEPLIDALASRQHVRMHWHIYVPGAADLGELPRQRLSAEHPLQVQVGRPDWDRLFAQIANRTPRLSAFACGPHTMMAEVSRLSRRYGWPMRTEKFL